MDINKLQFTDPDQLQFCIEIEKGKEYRYFQFNKDRNGLTKKLFDRYSGYPNQLIQDYHNNQGIKLILDDARNWFEKKINIEDISKEDIKDIISISGLNKNNFQNIDDYNQLIIEEYFELLYIFR
ncbi:MAG: hypothetical protein IKT40_12350 [Bacilli bacterium]|nr:hypothetical protein [Bacilli bacterium]